MSHRKVVIPLSVEGITKLRREIEAFRADILLKEQLFVQQLAEVGRNSAQTRFDSSSHNDNPDPISVTVESLGYGMKVVANGEAVCFIEFGAGVYYNGTEPYPTQRPQGIVGIGQYGKGRGKKDTWKYTDANGNVVKTHGTKATMPMWMSMEEIRNSAITIAKGVFG